MRRAGAAVHAVLVGLLVAGAWAATATEPFTWHMRVATAVGGLAAVVVGVAANRRHPPRRTPPAGRHPATFAVWVALAAAIGVFQLHMFNQEPRELYPTISSLVNRLFESHPVRALGYLLWLALGVYLLRR